MAADYGLMGGIGQGIERGLLAYQKQKQLNRDNQIQNLVSGVEEDENGNIKASAGLLAKQKAQEAQSRGLLESQDVTSERSRHYTQALQKAGLPVPDKLSEAQLKELQPIYLSKIKGDQAKDLANKRMSFQEQRLGLQEGKEARSAAAKDSLLNQYNQRLDGAAKVLDLIHSAQSGKPDKVVSNQALLGQLNAEVSRLETGSQNPGLGQGEKTELLDRKAQLQALIDSWTGNPQDAVSPENLEAAGKLVKELSSSYKKGIKARFEFLKGGSTDKQKKIFDDKMSSTEKSYSPRVGSFNEAAPQQQPQAQAHPQDEPAIAWARANPNDPRSAKILQANGVR
jgi:hypothetical protein